MAITSRRLLGRDSFDQEDFLQQSQVSSDGIPWQAELVAQRAGDEKLARSSRDQVRERMHRRCVFDLAQLDDIPVDQVRDVGREEARTSSACRGSMRPMGEDENDEVMALL